MFAGVIVACLLGIAIFFAFGFISRLVVGHWYEETR
jgi:NitT/TauT family transport system permease protein